MRSLEEAESRVRKYESRLSEEDIVPADTTAIQTVRDQLGVTDTSTIRWSSQFKEKNITLQNLHLYSHSSSFHPSPEVAG